MTVLPERIHDRCALRHLHTRARACRGDAVAAHEDDRVVHGRRARAIDQPRPDDRGDRPAAPRCALRRRGDGQEKGRAQDQSFTSHRSSDMEL